MQAGRAISTLITPHGDRERVLICGVGFSNFTSLPLMGIGNEIRPVSEDLENLLITPHGDREPGRHRPPQAALGPHYPSWGSGTMPPARSIRLDKSHYPSWGSGTLLTLMGSNRTTNSLPLMGIGNAAIRPHGNDEGKAHYPSWGSGTFRRRRGHSDPVRLITPHGDREPVSLDQSANNSLHSLPLMGIGNDPIDAADRTPRTSHYPSWGSGTPPTFRRF